MVHPRALRPLAALVAVALAAGAGLGAPARASAVDLFGYGARGAALAGAATSTAGGHAAVYYNPGGLAFDEGPSFAVGWQTAAFRLAIDGRRTDTRDAPALTLGLALPLPLRGWLAGRLAFAFGFVIPQTSILIADVPRPGDPSLALLDNRAQTVSLQAAFAFRPHDRISVGAGVLALAGVIGSVDVAPNEAGLIGSDVNNEVPAQYAAVAGVMARPTDRLSLGLTFHGESRADFDFPVRTNLGDAFPLPIPELTIKGTAQFDPRQLALEASVRPVPALLLAAGATWKQWSRYPSPIEYTAVPVGYPPQPAPRFRDTVVARLGAEGTLALGPAVTLRPRAGLAFEPTPTRPQRGFRNDLDNDRVIVGLGAGLAWRMLRLDLAFQAQHLRPRAVTKDPAAVEALGLDSATHPGYPRVRHDGSVLFGGVEIGVQL